jgi:hypothetical protein
MVYHFPPFAETLHEHTTTTVNEIAVDILRWERKNRVTKGATEEILGLMTRKIFPALHNSPTTRKQVMAILKPFKQDFFRTELCDCGAHRFKDQSTPESDPCEGCGKARWNLTLRKKTTNTFMWFELHDRLRGIFTRPSRVQMLMEAANHIPTPEAMKDIKGSSLVVTPIYRQRLSHCCNNT